MHGNQLGFEFPDLRPKKIGANFGVGQVRANSFSWRKLKASKSYGLAIRTTTMASNESHILVINSGSSSLKFTVFDPASEEILASGMAERLGTDGARLKLVDLAQKKHDEELPMA